MIRISSINLENTRTKIIVFACFTRLVAIVLQIIANAIIPDHEANVFTYPKSNLTNSFYDSVVTFTLGGFVRWDAQYFMHIAKYGYTYENTLAFFPLYPLLVKTMSVMLTYIFVFLNEDSVLLLTFILLNCFLFSKAAITLYELTLIVLNNDLAYKSAILFCINPATVFFIAPYSECLFSYLTLKAMRNCFLAFNKPSKVSNISKFKDIIEIIIPLSLSTSVRSNGILNIGFITYFIIQFAFKNLHLKSIKKLFIIILKYTVFLILIILTCSVPFILVQIYDYYKYCTDFSHSLPQNVIDFGLVNNLILPGQVSIHKQTWCFKKIPLAYSYVQDHYWNVGVLRYFEFRQIPNFMLAFPIIYIIVTNSIKFFKCHKNYCLNLGIFRFKWCTNNKITGDCNFKKEMFVFVVHALFLTVFCTFCIHVQVTTRIICSGSPVPYWFTAYYFESCKKKSNSLENIFLNKNRNNYARCTIYYFLSYFIVGVVMFTNFLPWT